MSETEQDESSDPGLNPVLVGLLVVVLALIAVVILTTMSGKQVSNVFSNISFGLSG